MNGGEIEGGWTPGPWRVVVDDTGKRPLTVPSIQASEELDCAIVHWDGFWQPYWQSARGEKEWNANARLMAAAPELFAALERMVATYGHLDGYGENQPSDEAAAALNKALGK